MGQKIGLALLIDDEEIDQRQYKRVLKRSDLIGEIMSFTYADEALAYLKENPGLEVDVIFLDINIPRMNGLEFLSAATQELGASFAGVVVAMLTTSLIPEDRRRAEAFEIVKAFINKPLCLEDVQRVAAMLPDRECSE